MDEAPARNQLPYPGARLLVFAKAPLPGRVKTRLCGKLGSRGAARLQQRLLWRTVAAASTAALCPVEVWCSPTTAHPLFLALRRRFGVRLRRQRGGDLGRRMFHALQATWRRAAAGAVLVGSDCPDMGSRQWRQALEWLHDGADAVLGPARDGGYVLIGTRAPAGRLFRGIPWGSDRVCRITRQRLRGLRRRWRELPQQADIDTPAELKGRRMRLFG
jgi:rSAM/selenodomain-associated transferase 1